MSKNYTSVPGLGSSVTLPFQLVVERFIQPALRKQLADSQAAALAKAGFHRAPRLHSTAWYDLCISHIAN